MKAIDMWLHNSLIVISLSILLCGCASTFETRPYKDKAHYQQGSDDEGIQNGIAYYENQPYLVTYELSAYQLDTKSITNCTRVKQKPEIQFIPARKMVLVNHPSLFSSSTLAVGFNTNGTLSSINTVSTPVADKLFSTLIGALETIAVAKEANFDTLPLCNSVPVVTGFKRIDNYEDIPKYLGN